MRTRKVAFVTGAARGLGQAIASRLLQEGYQVVAFDNHRDNLAERKKDWHDAEDRVLYFIGDVRDRESVQEAVDSTLKKWERIDTLANVAGIAGETPFLEISPSKWQEIIDINLTGTFNVAQLIARQMVKQKEGGVIINMASKNGISAEVKYAHYNASKAGVILLTKSMAMDLADYNIRVNAVAPGYIVTPMSSEMDSKEFMMYYQKQLIPLNRLGTPDDVAGAFVFLASDEASFITGHTLVVDGGQISHDGRKFNSYGSEKV